MLCKLEKVFIIGLYAFLFAACGITSKTAKSSAVQTPQTGDTGSSFLVDPVFREYYNYLGGEKVLGPAISPASQEGATTVQFIESGKMVYDPSAPALRRFGMAPLGVQMELKEPSVPAPTLPGLRYINGHIISPDFLSFYEKLGANTVGNPLTEMRYNPLRRRYEQFFENLGIFRPEGTDKVGLLAYGAWVCDNQCRSGLHNKDALMDIHGFLDKTYGPFVKTMGTDFTGFPLTESYPGSDGNKEQILENVVLAADPNSNVSLRPLSEKLKILAEPPSEYSGDPSMYFFSTNGKDGYEIPNFIWDYITQHGGIENFGPPITHFSPLFGAAYHQCFQKICLAYYPGGSGDQIRPEPLGYAYKVLYYDGKPKLVVQPAVSAAETLTTTAVLTTTATPAVKVERETTLQVWVRYPAVDSKQPQEVGVIVTENDKPVADKLLHLILTLPNGSLQSYLFPPTNEKGITNLRIPPIAGSNGTLILYKACMELQPEYKFCVGDNFVIWNNP